MEVTIGGNRVGSGKKMKAHLHNYERSTHNLSEEFITSAGAGILYPCMCKLAMRGDSFDINLDFDLRTIPTEGPLFGKFKAQVDVYQCPVRLYQGILHNNPLAIGLKMQQVKFPLLEITTTGKKGDYKCGEFNNSALLKYLGMSGLGYGSNIGNANDTFGRKINALPALAYYDIFKTYYANKQEENAYIISAVNTETTTKIQKIEAWYSGEYFDITLPGELVTTYNQNSELIIRYTFEDLEKYIESNGSENAVILNSSLTTEISYSFNDLINISKNSYPGQSIYVIKATNELVITIQNYLITDDNGDIAVQVTDELNATLEKYQKLSLEPFKLSNIDDMRYDLLSAHTLGTAFEIKDNEYAYLPYKALVDKDNDGQTLNRYPLNGLCIKTYQNDIFNNWLNTEWIEGENSISELSKVAIVDGAFSMDSLNFATKLYNMLNRIAVAGATYEDWQDVVYEQTQRRQIESPIFCGGMSKLICFDEIVQTAPTGEKGTETYQALGQLGGRGRAINESQKGGKLHIKCDEACFIIALVSLTPLINYHQGNEFYMTDVFSMDDLHKPAMDGIGFQDLIGERMASFDTIVTTNSTNVLHRSKIGKLPAWIEYMTSYNRSYGDFASNEGFGYMSLNRNYEQDETTHRIKDATTYIDPQKYNYIFAYNGLDAQNFWIKVVLDIKARRKMSARLIPNV